MWKQIAKSGPLGLTWLVALGACDRSQPVARAVSTSDLTSNEYNAAYRIAAARCDRQTPACSSFASREACLRSKLASSAADVRLEDCSDPILDGHLNACVNAIQHAACGTGITGIEACHPRAICPYVAEEGTL